MLLTRKYITGSVIAHLVVIIITSLIGLQESTIKKTFVVLGAHSRQHAATTYKSTKHITPFVGNGPQGTSTKKSSGNKAHVKNKKALKKAKKIMKKEAVQEEAKVLPGAIKEIDDEVHVSSQKDGKKNKKAGRHKQKERKQKPEPKKPVDEPIKEIEEVEIEVEVKEEQPLAAVTHEPETQMPDDQNPESPDQESAGDNQNSNFIGEYNSEQMLVYQKHVQEISNLWRPPLGVPKGTLCTIKLKLAHDGTIENYEVINPSGILIYDLSVKRTIKNFSFNKCLHGKEFTIDFRQ